MNRGEALELVTTHVKNRNLVRHMLAVEAIMRDLAGRLGADPDLWGLAGLLHDLDYELSAEDPTRHGLMTAELLAGRDVEPSILQAIRAHVGGERPATMDKALYVADRLTGLVVAAALIHPTRKLAAIDAEFVLHRFGEKRFAPGANRDEIRSCSELGMSLEEFISLGLRAMQGISGELGL
jgi:uncharacterized protein